jgi:putative hydrolase of the HAD superfamily
MFSNHVPELSALASALDLAGQFDRILTSALLGYEKPNPRAFELALDACGHPGEVWMVGDSPIADVAGAEALGIPAILVRSGTSLGEVAEMIQASGPRSAPPRGPGG